MKSLPLVSVSMLAANFGKLDAEIEMVNNSYADWFHLDIMDGVFVPNISYGFPIVEHINKNKKKPLDVHLMIVEPDRYFDQFKNAGADILTVHYEACTHLHRSIQRIKSLDMKAGVALNPHTPVSLLEDIIADVDLVLIMSVNPGFGGQSFIDNSINKISRLKELILQKQSGALIEVDGGVSTNNVQQLFNAGCDVLVAGSAIFKAQQPMLYVEEMKRLAQERPE